MNHQKKASILRISLQSIKYHFFSYVLVIILSQIVAGLIFDKVAMRLFSFALESANVVGLTNDNFVSVISHPTSLAVLFVTVVVVALLMVFEMVSMMTLVQASYTKKTITSKAFWVPFKKLISPSMLALMVYLFVLMPNANLGITSTFASDIHLPSFIVAFFKENPWMLAVYTGGLVLIFMLNFLCYYTPAIFIIEPETGFTQALLKSIDMTRKAPFKVFKLICITTLISLAIALVGFVLVFLLGYALFVATSSTTRVAETLISSSFFVIAIFAGTFGRILTYQSMVVAYYDFQGVTFDAIGMKNVQKDKKHTKRMLLLLSLGFVVLNVSLYFEALAEPLPTITQIVAHRGNTTLAIENTLESLSIASQAGADMVEMDVQQTLDGELVVHHDYNLKRLGGVNRNINDMRLDEVQQVVLRKGSFQSRVPSLKEYLTLAKTLNQAIMIELKTTSKDDNNLMDKLMQTVHDTQMQSMVRFQSLDKRAIVELETRFPDAITGYILGFSFGGLEALNVDFFSIEDSSVKQAVFHDLQKYHKQLYVWTINEGERMDQYFNRNVNGIITDNVDLAKERKEAHASQNFLDRIWRIIENS